VTPVIGTTYTWREVTTHFQGYAWPPGCGGADRAAPGGDALSGLGGVRSQTMPHCEMPPTTFRPIPEASFAAMGIGERLDVQRLLKTQIDVLGDDRYVLTEEFGDWEDSRCKPAITTGRCQGHSAAGEPRRLGDGFSARWSQRS
jgi:hypothetical protein